MYRSILILGGDRRNISLANHLKSDGYDVAAFGFNDYSEFHDEVCVRETIEEALNLSDVVVSGIPASIDDMTLNTPLYDKKIYFYSLFDMLKGDKVFLGGKMSERLMHMADVYDVDAIDYFEREELKVLNTIPTVEGALQTAMEETPYTLHFAKCLVLGFGRIGKLLSRYLSFMGADVTVEARKLSDIAWIKALGYKGINIKDVDRGISQYDIIFNTVPFEILKEKDYKHMKKSCLMIDLASLPGGLDSKEAERNRLRIIRALSLPGKCAPESAASYVKETIINILDEM